MDNYVVFVNTCDKFEDCWNPFFKLFSIYWPDFEGKIYLNTEYKEFKYPGLDIISIKNSEKSRDAHRITWSECLKRGLSSIDNEVVLYLQEDYFLKSEVSDKVIEDYAQLIRKENVDCIHLTDQHVNGKLIESSPFKGLWTIPYDIEYRISCQAALWKKAQFLKYIRTYESAWDFEMLGSKRAKVLKHNFYTVDRTIVKLNKYEIIPYIFTGIIKGKWFEQVVPLFNKHNISIDYSVRGITANTGFKTLKMRIDEKRKRFPNYVRNIFDMLALRISSSNK